MYGVFMQKQGDFGREKADRGRRRSRDALRDGLDCPLTTECFFVANSLEQVLLYKGSCPDGSGRRGQ